jgi:hypothetical protein
VKLEVVIPQSAYQQMSADGYLQSAALMPWCSIAPLHLILLGFLRYQNINNAA